MKFIKTTSVYMFKNIGQLLLLCIVPAVFIGALCSPFQIFEFFNIYSTFPVVSFSSVFELLMGMSLLRFILSFIGFVLLIVFASAVFGYIENHMRSGKRNLKSVPTAVNNNIVAVLANMLIMAIIYICIVFLFGALIFLFHIIFSGINNSPNIVSMILSFLLLSAGLILIVNLFMYLMLNIPNMIINGYPIRECFSITIRQVSKNAFSVLIAYLLPIAIIIPFVCLSYGTAWIYVVNILGILILQMYWYTLSSVLYFELTNTTRYDNRKYYNLKQ